MILDYMLIYKYFYISYFVILNIYASQVPIHMSLAIAQLVRDVCVLCA